MPASNWTAENPTLAQFEEGVESDTGKIKRGPGLWNSLQYLNPSGGPTGAIPVKASGAEVDTGTDDAKFVTAKAIADSNLTFLSEVQDLVGVKASADEVLFKASNLSDLNDPAAARENLGFVNPVANGTYMVGTGALTPGTITTVNGIITAVQEAADA